MCCLGVTVVSVLLTVLAAVFVSPWLLLLAVLIGAAGWIAFEAGAP
jgi:hypothetical protein